MLTARRQDVIIGTGCSGALEMAITVLCDAGQNILVPRPGFSLYETIAKTRGVDVRRYDLLPERQWEIDLPHLESLIDDATAAIVLNNPGNPCGSNYSREHLLALLDVAARNFVPIISDETYADMVFDGETFHPLAPLSRTVPILTCSGTAKRYLVPGWRLGWILIHDRNNLFAREIRAGLIGLSQLVLGANSLVQAALPDMLTQTDEAFHKRTMDILQTNAKLTYSLLAQVPGLKPVMPQVQLPRSRDRRAYRVMPSYAARAPAEPRHWSTGSHVSDVRLRAVGLS